MHRPEVDAATHTLGPKPSFLAERAEPMLDVADRPLVFERMPWMSHGGDKIVALADLSRQPAVRGRLRGPYDRHGEWGLTFIELVRGFLSGGRTAS